MTAVWIAVGVLVAVCAASSPTTTRPRGATTVSEIYSSPEKYGLRTIGEVEWGDGDYSFDLTVVWQDTTTGALYFGDDSGCSCPSPFEDMGRDQLAVIDRPQVFIDHINGRIANLYDWNERENERAKGDAGQLAQKVREALR